MKAKYKNKEVELWEISHSKSMPDWVSKAFQKNILKWVDNRLCALMPALYSNWSDRGEFYGYGIYVFGEIGDFIDVTNGKIISKSDFEKNYILIGSEN